MDRLLLALALVSALLLPPPLGRSVPSPALAQTAGEIYVVDPITIEVIRVDPVTGAQAVVSSGGNFSFPAGIAIAANGDLLVADLSCCGGLSGGVIRVNPVTGAQAVVSSGGNFSSPQAIAIAPVLSIDSPTIAEGQGGTTNLTFTVSLAPYTSQTVTVQYATADGTAQAGSDYTAVGGTLTFAPGDSTGTITVPVTGDTLFEPDETVRVNLTNPSGATLASAQATGTIQNDDPQPALSIGGASVTEGDAGTATVTLTVSLSASSSQTVTVQYATTDGTAQAGSDYQAAASTLTFAPGDTMETIAVQVIGDALDEADETLLVALSNPSGATLGQAQGTGTILDDDPQPTLGIAGISVPEGDAGGGTATFTVSLSAPSGRTVTVQYATADGTATAGSDYTATAGTVTFAPGVTSQAIGVAILGDTVVEPDETLTVTASNPTNATLGTAQATGTILNDDAAATPPPTATPTGTPLPTATSTATATLTPPPSPTATPTVPPAPAEDDDEPRALTEEQRQQRERTNASNLDQYRTEGQVTAVEVAPDGVALLATIALGRGEALVVEVRCPPVSCPDIRIGDYIEAAGEQGGREELGRFVAEDLSVTRGGRRIR